MTAKLLCHLGWDRVQKDASRAQRVVADYFFGIRLVDENVGGGRAPLHFLPRLFLQVRVEGFAATIEALTVMF